MFRWRSLQKQQSCTAMSSTGTYKRPGNETICIYMSSQYMSSQNELAACSNMVRIVEAISVQCKLLQQNGPVTTSHFEVKWNINRAGKACFQ